MRAGYVKFYREFMRREYIDDFVDESLREHFGSEIGGKDSPWSLRISPRFSRATDAIPVETWPTRSIFSAASMDIILVSSKWRFSAAPKGRFANG